jgi:hypothetical protein
LPRGVSSRSGALEKETAANLMTKIGGGPRLREAGRSNSALHELLKSFSVIEPIGR